MTALTLYIVTLGQLNDTAFVKPGSSSESEEDQDKEVQKENGVEVEEEEDQDLTEDKNERDDRGEEIIVDLKA
jgi:hypothetical protein